MKKIIVTMAGLLMCLGANADWQYVSDTDTMTGKPTKIAMIESVNSLALGSPYKGENRGGLAVRQTPKQGLNVIFKIDKGQLICDSYHGCQISVRFDDAPPVRFTAGGTTDHSSTTLFIHNERKFVAAAAKAKRILVQVVIYQAGQNILEFKTAKPLEWGLKK